MALAFLQVIFPSSDCPATSIDPTSLVTLEGLNLMHVMCASLLYTLYVPLPLCGNEVL